MIERQFVAQKMKELQIQEFVASNLKNIGHSHTKIQRTPLGEKVIIYASRPGLVVGRKGQNIKKLTMVLKRKFELENPQIEISEVENIYLDAQIVAEIVSSSLEKFGSARFKGIGHKVMADVMNAGALGVEILISGKIPSTRAKSWRFYQGYLKKSGDVAFIGVRKAYAAAQLKSGTIGVQVSIMPPTTKLPDHIQFIEEAKVEEVKAAKEEKPESGEKEGAKTEEETPEEMPTEPKEEAEEQKK